MSSFKKELHSANRKLIRAANKMNISASELQLRMASEPDYFNVVLVDMVRQRLAFLGVSVKEAKYIANGSPMELQVLQTLVSNFKRAVEMADCMFVSKFVWPRLAEYLNAPELHRERLSRALEVLALVRGSEPITKFTLPEELQCSAYTWSRLHRRVAVPSYL